MAEEIDITIIGGGVVGWAIAYELSKSFNKTICVVEKNQSIRGENQSSRNSGVVHAGIYYQKNKEPLKAKLCVEGNKLLYEFCEEHKLPCKKTGKIVVATNMREEEYLDQVLSIAQENKVPGIRKISGAESNSFEPNVKATAALYVPSTGIVEQTLLIDKLHHLAEEKNAIFLKGNEVVGISPKNGKFEVTTKSGDNTEFFETKVLINSAGLYSDDIGKMINPDLPYRIIPIRGEYSKFYRTKRANINMNGLNVYPAPHGVSIDGKKLDISYDEFKNLFNEGKIKRTVGVHLTPTFDMSEDNYVLGTTVIIGPYYIASAGKEDYKEKIDKSAFFKRIKDYFPNIELEDISLHQTGIQAHLAQHNDFVIESDKKHSNCIQLIGIGSPGLTSSLAIAKYVKQMLE